MGNISSVMYWNDALDYEEVTMRDTWEAYCESKAKQKREVICMLKVAVVYLVILCVCFIFAFSGRSVR